MRFRVIVRGGRVVAGPIRGAATPLRRVRDAQRLLRIAFGECGSGLLIGSLPEIGERSGLRARRRCHDREDDRHQPAAAKAEQCKRQQQEQQPRSTVAPARALHGFRRCVRRLVATEADGGASEQHIQIVGIGTQARVAPPPGCGDRAQARFVESRHDDVAAGVLHEIALCQRYRGTGRGAYAEHRHDEGVRVRLARSRGRVGARAVGEQDDFAAAQAGLFDQRGGGIDRARGRVAGDRHRARIERIDQVTHRADVIGQRRRDERIGAVADQGGLVVATARQDVVELEARAGQPVRLFILREHAWRKLEHEYARALVAVQRHR